MSDFIGRIAVPAIPSSGLTFPLVTDFPYGYSQSVPVITHRFGELDAKSEQRYLVGIGPKKHAFRRQHLGLASRTSLASFWESLAGSFQSFLYNAPNADQTTTSVTVLWEEQPFSLTYMVNACQVGFNFLEIPNPASAPSYSVASTCTRFPSGTLATALQSQVQQIIPLVHIRVRESAVSDIYLSDRRVIVAGQTYLPRLLGFGEPGTDNLISQNINGQADNVAFQFANGDQVMTQLCNDTDLKYAQIDISLYHVNSGILLQLWSGFIQSFDVNGTPVFSVQCSDGIFQISQQYPNRLVSRTCWKTYNDGLNCPWSLAGASSGTVTANGGDPTQCDFGWNTSNGCIVHGMGLYFGGIPAIPQSVNVKDNSTGFHGFDRNTVTATSIVSDTVWGRPLPDIWCNQQSSATNAYMANALIAVVRDNGDFFDVLGILGSGPLGAFTISTAYAGEFVTNSDGYTYLVAPLADNIPAQGLKIASNGTSTSTNSALGLRQVLGADPLPVLVRTFSGTAWGSTGVGDGGGINVFSIQTSGLLAIFEAFTSLSLTGVFTALLGGSHGAPAGATAINIGHLLTMSTVLTGDQFVLSGVTYTVTHNVTTDHLGNTPVSFSPPLAVDTPDGTLISTSNSYSQFGLANIVGGVKPTLVGSESSLPFAAGTAFCELLYSKPSGFTPSLADSHSMTVPVAQGLTGWTFNGSTRTAQGGLINPFWIALNTFLRATGNQSASGSAQQALFVQDSFFKGDGTGAAEISDLVVTPLIGSGTELQFQFQGTIAEQKPLRDWLVEILNTGLGYFTFEFGKLKVGIRSNASSVDAYTIGSAKFQSLALKPIEAAFESLTMDFADVEYQYQANTVTYTDKTHAAYYGRPGAPLSSRMHSVGSSSMSQSLRIAATRTREELGGVNAAEWRNARMATWETTLLGLGNEVGQVVSFTDPIKIPGPRGVCNVSAGTVTWVSGDPFDGSMLNKDILIAGVQYAVTAMAGGFVSFTTTPTAATGSGVAFKIITMDFRILSWALRKDWSILISGKTVTPSMYDLEQGPMPLDVLPAVPPQFLFPLPDGPQWCPYQVQYASASPLLPGSWTFDLSITSSVDAAGNPVIVSQVVGKMPANKLNGDAAPTGGAITIATTGGSIPGGAQIRICIGTLDVNGLPGAQSQIGLIVMPPSTNTNMITFADVTWPTVTGLGQWVIYASTRDDQICSQATGALTATGGGLTYTPTSISMTALLPTTWALPNPNVTGVVVKAKYAVHTGIIGGSIDSVGSFSLTTGSLNTGGAAFATGPGGSITPVGRTLSIIGRQSGAIPVFNAVVTAWNGSTGVVGLSIDPTGIVLPGDAYTLRFQVDPSYYGPQQTQVYDGGLNNFSTFALHSTIFPGVSIGGYTGLEIDQDKGMLLRVIDGTSVGQVRLVTANQPQTFYWDEPLALDATSVWIIEEPNWLYRGDVYNLANANPLTAGTLSLVVENYATAVLLVSVFTEGVQESPDSDQTIREAWTYGVAGSGGGGAIAVTNNGVPVNY